MAVRFHPLAPGDPTEVAGYALRARLGSGGMGAVYLSFSRGGRPVAIKVVKREFADDPEFRRRFAREVSAAQQVQGHYTAPVVDADPDAPVPWLATAYIAGPSLQGAVSEHGRLPLFTAFRLLAGAAEGVAAVHAADLIHRDLKPANVLLAEDGPRVIDFGIVHAANSSTLTGKGNAVGTPGYMAPEQIRGKVSEATDVFGLGHLALYAATGHTAFGDGLTEALFYRILNEPPDFDGCPAELRPIVERCLAKTPADRPTVTEVIDFARAAMRGDTMRVVDEPWLPPPVADTLPAYAPDAAPPLPPPAASATVVPPIPLTVPPVPPAPTAPPASAPPADSGLRRRLLRPALTISAVLLLALGGYLGYTIGHSGSGGNGTPGLTGSTTDAGTGTTSATAAGSQSTASPTTRALASSSASPAGYAQEWAGRQFSMPGAGCSGGFGNFVPSYVVFDASAGPLVTVSGEFGQPTGDLYIYCYANSNSTYSPMIEFNGEQAAQTSGVSSASACDTAVNTHPLANGGIPYSALSAGTQFCVAAGQTGSELVLLTLQSVDTTTFDLSWTATAWQAPS